MRIHHPTISTYYSSQIQQEYVILVAQIMSSSGEPNELKSEAISSSNQTNINTMEPTENDVLSGLGAWLNQHPGTEHFRKIIEEQKAAYMTGTKRQKMNITMAIVEAIYSKEPPGRFLKKCTETGRWKELSKREAADKAAQAMAYAVRGESLKQKKRERRRRSRSLPSWTLPSSPQDDAGTASASSQTSDRPTNNRLEGNVASSVEHKLAARGAIGTNKAETPSSQPQDNAGTASSQTSDRPTNNRLEGNVASSVEHKLAARGAIGTNNAASPSSQPQDNVGTASSQTSDRPTNNRLEGSVASSVEHRLAARGAIGTNNAESAVNDGHADSGANEPELPFPGNSNLQQQPLQQLQQSSSTTHPAAAGAPLTVNQNVLVQVLTQAHQQQRQHHQQQQQHHLQQLHHLLLQHTLGQHLLGQLQRTNQLPLLEGFAQLLAQAQQQQQQQLILPQHVFGQNSLGLPYSPQSQHPSNAYLLSMLNNVQSQPNIGTSNSNSPQQAQQMDQMQRSLARQQQQLLVLSLITSNQMLIQQQQHQPHPPNQTLQTAQLRQNQNSQSLPPINEQTSANAADASNMQEESDDE